MKKHSCTIHLGFKFLIKPVYLQWCCHGAAEILTPQVVLRLSEPSPAGFPSRPRPLRCVVELHRHLMAGGWLTFLSLQDLWSKKQQKEPPKEAGVETKPLVGNMLVFSHHQKTLGDSALSDIETSPAFIRAANLAFKRCISTINHNNITPRMECETKMSWACLWLSSVFLSFRPHLIKSF